MGRISFREALDYVSTLLNCTQRTIASLIGVQESTLSANSAKPLSKVRTKKAGKRLIRLMEVVLHFSELGLATRAIMQILTDPIHQNDDGFYESVKDCYLPPNGHHFLAKNSHPWSPVRNWLFSPAVTG